MKDYSLNKEDKKNFILGYVPDDNGNLSVNFAEGESWNIPYTEKNEEILLNKMKEQVKKSDEFYEKAKNKREKNSTRGVGMVLLSILMLTFTFYGKVTLFVSLASLFGIISIPFIVKSVKLSSVLADLEKNRKFIKMEDELNKNLSYEKNGLANVSKKTKDVIEEFQDEEHIFNINSFNYVPFKDLEQIMENVERNSIFGFEYDDDEKETLIARKRIRKM